jgi:hypothetical protein
MKKYSEIKFTSYKFNIIHYLYVFFYNLKSYTNFFYGIHLNDKIYNKKKINYKSIFYDIFLQEQNFEIIITNISFANGYIALLNKSYNNYSNKYFKNKNIDNIYTYRKLISSRVIIVPKNYILDTYFNNNKDTMESICAYICIYNIDDIYCYGIINQDFYNKFIAYFICILYFFFISSILIYNLL